MIGKKKSKKVAKIPSLPKQIRQELQTKRALKELSHMKDGKSKRLQEQYVQMDKFFHGKPPNHSSQINILAEGRFTYSDLYEEVEMAATKKNDDSTTVKILRLKNILIHDPSRIYYSRTDIRANDLEKKRIELVC